MARSADTDPLFAFNFALEELIVTNSSTPNLDSRVMPLTKGRDGDLMGFQSLSMPEASIEYQDIPEGNWPFPRKVALTRATIGEVTIAKAVMPNSSDFYIWFFQTLYGRGGPRRDFLIHHLRPGNITARRVLRLNGCTPVTWKPGSDFDASSAEVSIEELTFNVENIRLEIPEASNRVVRTVVRR